MTQRDSFSIRNWGPLIAGITGVFIGAFWLLAWFGGWADELAATGAIIVKTNMALCQILGGTALLLLRKTELRKARIAAGVSIALFIVIVGALTTGEHLFHHNLGIDQLLATEVPGAAATASPNRMGPVGAFSLVLLGAGLLALASRRRALAPYFGLAVCVINFVPAIGFLYGIEEFYTLPTLTGMAWPTMVALISLGGGVMLAETRQGPLAQLFRPDAGGALLRRMLPPAILIPLILGLIRVHGQLHGFYDVATGTGLLVIALIVIFSVFLWLSSSQLSRSAEAEAEAYQVLRDSESRLRQAQQIADVGSWEWDIKTGALLWSEQIYRQFAVQPGNFSSSYDAFLQHIHPEDRVLFERAIEQALAGKSPFNPEFRIIRPDGSIRVLHSRGELVRGSGNQPLRMVGVSIDITEQKDAEQELARLASYPTLNPNPIIEADFDGKVLYVNPVAIQLFPNIQEMGTEHSFLGNWDFIRNSSHDSGAIYRDISADGRWYHQAIHYLSDARKIRIYAFDITDRKTAQEALAENERRYRGIVETAEEGIATHAPDGTITYVNQRMADMLGYSRQEIIGKCSLDFVYDEDDKKEVIAAREHVKERGSLTKERKLRRKNGSLLWTLINISPRRDAAGTFLGYLAMHTDITERKKAEIELRRAKEELETRVEERTQELAARADQLRALAGELTLVEQRERSRLAKLLHDHLQQLLVAAKFRTTILGRGGDEVTKKASKEVEELIDESIAASRSLTAELSPPILHEAGLNAGLEWLARRMAESQGLFVDLELQESGSLPEGPKILLFESVRELLFNVVKHANVRSAIVNLRRFDDSLQVVVSDRGKGFDPVTLPPAGEAGRGLGLFVIRERLELMGGKFEMQSSPGQGSQFVLSMPVGPEAITPKTYREIVLPGAQPIAPVFSELGRKIRVLLVDDHAVVRQGMANLLGDEPDVEVVGQAADGQEAVELASKLLPDVILMDISMPKLNGVEATRLICNGWPETRIIGLSMYEEADRARAMLDAGAVNYLTKSGPADELLNAIRTCIRKEGSRTVQ